MPEYAPRDVQTMNAADAAMKELRLLLARTTPDSEAGKVLRTSLIVIDEELARLRESLNAKQSHT